MKDLSRQEKIERRIAELEREIRYKEDALDEEQGKRCKKTLFVLCGIIYLLIIYFSLKSHAVSINFVTIENIFYSIVGLTFGVVFFAGCIMFISYAVMAYITNGAMNRVQTMTKLKTELETIKYFDVKYKELYRE